MKRATIRPYSHWGTIIGDSDSPDSYRDRNNLTNEKKLLTDEN